MDGVRGISEEKQSLLAESSIFYWCTRTREELGDSKELTKLYDQAVDAEQEDKIRVALFLCTRPAFAGFLAAETLFVKLYRQVFPEPNLPKVVLECDVWKRLFSSETEASKSSEQFATEMQAAQVALRAVRSPQDLDVVSQHLEKARLYSTEPSVTLMSALFQASDVTATQVIRHAAAQGSGDAQYLLDLLEEYSGNWVTLQKKCYNFQRVVDHHRLHLLRNTNWESYACPNIIAPQQ